MALFLNESVQFDEPVLTVEEAQCGLLEAVTHMGSLNEAIMVADFTIHEKNRGLAESVILEAEEGFFKKVANSVIAFLKKVKEKVVAFFRAIGEKLKALWAKLTGSDATIRVAKSGPAQLEKVVSALEALEKAVESDGKSDAYKKAVEKADSAYQKAVESASKISNGEKSSKSFVEIKASALNKIQAAANRQTALAGIASGQMDAQIKAAEKAAAAKKAEESTKEDLAFARAKAAGYTTLAGSAGKLSAFISSLIALRAIGDSSEKA
jgi:hypothetical protein